MARKPKIKTPDTQIKHLEDALYRSEQRFYKIFYNNPLPIIITRLSDGLILDINDEYLKMSGYQKEEVMDHTVGELNIWVDQTDRLRMTELLKKQGAVRNMEAQFRNKSGKIRHGVFSAVLIEIAGAEPSVIAISQDITEMKWHAKNMSLLYETSLIFSSSVNLGEILHKISQRCAEVLQVDSVLVRLIENDYLIVKGSFYRHSEDKAEVERLMKANPIQIGKGIAGKVAQSGKSMVSGATPLEKLTLNGYMDYLSKRQWMVVPLKLKERVTGVLTLITADSHRAFSERDIRLAEGIANLSAVVIENAQLFENLRDNEEKYRTMIEHSNDMIWTLDTAGNFTYFDRVAEEISGYKLSEWLGKSFAPLIPAEDIPRIGNIFRETLEGKPRKYEVKVRRQDGSIFILSVSTAPIYKNGKVIGTVSFGRDITEEKLKEEELKQSHERLRQTLEGAVQALAATTRKRDAYTATHQQRVAFLATAIAREMNLTEEQIEGVRVAGVLHDIGKIDVPPELLSKKEKLTEQEKNIIKTHLEAGYEILKLIPFTMPVTHMVVQHHERIDGSGYPKGLKGKNIRLEARILAVADVVEAITFQRPYRPALGIGYALEEISQHKGVIYDQFVVDTCLKLFNENKFHFE